MWNYFHSATLDITASSGTNQIILSSINFDTKDNRSSSFKQITSYGKLNKDVKFGKYIVYVRQDKTMSSKIIDVNKRSTIKINIKLNQLGDVNTFANTEARDLSVINNKIFFLSILTHHIYSIDNNGNTIVYYPNNIFDEVRWYGNSQGIAKYQNNLFRIDLSANTISSINLGSLQLGQDFIYRTSINGEIYLYYSRYVYLIKSDNTINKIYALDSNSAVISVGNNLFTISYADVNRDYKTDILSINGLISSNKSNIPTISLAVSNDDKIIAQANKSTITLYDSNYVPQVVIPLSYKLTKMFWSNNILYYIQNDGSIYRYDYSNSRTDLVAYLPYNFVPVDGIVENNYFLISGINSTNPNYSEIKQININNNQSNISSANQLQDILPVKITDANIKLIRYGNNAYVQVIPISGSNNSQDYYINEAKNYINQLGINSSDVGYTYFSSDY